MARWWSENGVGGRRGGWGGVPGVEGADSKGKNLHLSQQSGEKVVETASLSRPLLLQPRKLKSLEAKTVAPVCILTMRTKQTNWDF